VLRNTPPESICSDAVMKLNEGETSSRARGRVAAYSLPLDGANWNTCERSRDSTARMAARVLNSSFGVAISMMDVKGAAPTASSR
jgi:hypothetical protein